MTSAQRFVRDVDVIEMTAPVRVAAARMHSHNVGCLVVVDRQHRPIGIVTDRDLAVRVVAAAKDAASTPVSEAMSAPVATLPETADLREIVAAMRKGPYRRIPLVDGQGRLSGLVALDDIWSDLAGQIQQIHELLYHESPDSLVAP